MAAQEILDDLVQALRDSGTFRAVTLGDAPASTAVPRACVTLESQEVLPCDDQASGRWVRLRAKVILHTRSDSDAAAVSRGAELSQSAVSALLADPCRGGLCQDLPIGPATQIGKIETSYLQRPNLQVQFIVTCHFEEE